MISMTWPQYQRRQCTVLRPVTVALSPQQLEILSILMLRHPQPVPSRDLVEALWPDPDTEPQWPECVVAAQVGKLRRKLGAGRILCDWRGYRLEQ